jgi:pimeloyl-ACP methyl ester carboxylesterase
VSSVVGFGVPIFPSQNEARKHIRSLGFMARLMSDNLPLGQRICGFMCDHRELARSVAPLLAPRLPAPVAADGVDHNWDSYSGTFRIVVNENQAREWASEMGSRLTLIYGADDRSCPPALAMATLSTAAKVRLEVQRDCDHHLPLRRARLARGAIARLL